VTEQDAKDSLTFLDDFLQTALMIPEAHADTICHVLDPCVEAVGPRSRVGGRLHIVAKHLVRALHELMTLSGLEPSRRHPGGEERALDE